MISKTDSEPSAKASQATFRITFDLQIMKGKRCSRGMRVTVEMIVGQIRSGRTIENVLKDFPYLELEDILEALNYSS